MLIPIVNNISDNSVNNCANLWIPRNLGWKTLLYKLNFREKIAQARFYGCLRLQFSYTSYNMSLAMS